MDNSTTLTFTLTAYLMLAKHKYVFFILFLLLYIVTVVLNVLLITVIHQNKDLHQPMNIFASMLSFNELYGMSALLPLTMSILMSKTHEISVNSCIAQVYWLHTYGSLEYCILALMAYDRYLAICYPLHYQTIMLPSKVKALIALVAVYPFIVFGCFFSMTAQLSFCGKFIPKLYCLNMELVKNSCTPTYHINIAGLLLIGLLIAPQIFMVFFSYVRIFRVCKKLSKKNQVNALKKCAPHLTSFLNFSIGTLFDVAQQRFDMSHIAMEVRILLSTFFAVCPPFANPILYGLGTYLIRVHIKKMCNRYKQRG
ncbi:olfactory receptor 52L1-like [Corythoichthys intestinalis]|uniref:olfactory receptor 52L1-like n=1 Tax=Corythoichthys intestinalis TaxID=161448 RepID=UPI0025A56C72|nr:olfactory receptor 52L1-like [Corythoichthys intestinalis]XP_061801216.1 olfactory receptor 52L1-like [Nerophis lumbriciformis]